MALSRPKHGFESRWGRTPFHVSVDCPLKQPTIVAVERVGIAVPGQPRPESFVVALRCDSRPTASLTAFSHRRQSEMRTSGLN